jgi:predicted lipoprotein
MKNTHLYGLSMLIILLGINISCKSKKSDDPTTHSTVAATYDRIAFLNNMAQNIIIPRYLDLKTKIATLQNSASVFASNPSVSSLETARVDFLLAYKSWEGLAQFSFGPADVNGLVNTQVDVFPTNTATIESNITSGSYDFNAAASSGFSGFPAIDYLLFSKTLTEQQIADLYTNSANRKKYLNDVVTNLTNRVNTTYAQWIGGSNYLSIFKTLNGTDVSSSTSALLNQMAINIDNFKNYKLGIPLGANSQVGSGPAYNGSNANEAEAYYSDSSLALIRASLLSMRDMYMGKTLAGIDSTGFDDYLIAINQGPLNQKIINEFNTIITKINAIPETYSQSLSDPNKKILIENVFSETSLLLKYFKVDLSTATNVEITFFDNDGD